METFLTEKWNNPSEFFFQSDLQTLEVVNKRVFHNSMLGKVTMAQGIEMNSHCALQNQV